MIKFYNLIFHSLRALHHKDLVTLPTSRRTGRKRLDNYLELLNSLEAYQHRVGGFRLETRMRATTLAEAVQEYGRTRAFKLDEMLRPATLVPHSIAVDDYLQQVRGKLEIAEVLLRRSGVTRQPSCAFDSRTKKDFWTSEESFWVYNSALTQDCFSNSLVETICVRTTC